MKKLVLIPLIIFLSACKKEKFDIVNLNGNQIIALGHGGMGLSSTYPMDSYESLMESLNTGADGTEFDVQMTKDSVLVLYHDVDLSDNTTLKGCINSLNWNEVQAAKYNQTPYLNYTIITLDQFLLNVTNRNQREFIFDCKLYTENPDIQQFYRSYINAVTRIVHNYGLEINVRIESQEPDFLKLFKQKSLRYKLYIYPSSFESGLEIAKSLDLFGITISTKNISKEQIKIAHDNNIWVTLWNIHTEADNKEAIKKNPDCIQTDKLKNLIKLLR
jgi:glycerophosphoryl diester phosphodiesterase